MYLKMRKKDKTKFISNSILLALTHFGILISFGIILDAFSRRRAQHYNPVSFSSDLSTPLYINLLEKMGSFLTWPLGLFLDLKPVNNFFFGEYGKRPSNTWWLFLFLANSLIWGFGIVTISLSMKNLRGKNDKKK